MCSIVLNDNTLCGRKFATYIQETTLQVPYKLLLNEHLLKVVDFLCNNHCFTPRDYTRSFGGYCLRCSGRVGRLGLAISLVATEQEKVWYCTKKGYKPWLKPGKQDVRTHEEGGHTIWQNESEMLKVSMSSCQSLLFQWKVHYRSSRDTSESIYLVLLWWKKNP